MKLNRETKYGLKSGDVLRDGNAEYTVIRTIPGKNGALSVTLRCADGRTIYACPSFQLYGMEIVRKS